MDVVGIVLAAGSSRRLGRPKQTLAFGGRTLLAHVVADVEASVLDRVVVVLGSDATAVMLERGRAELTHAESEGGGCASSLQAGLDAAGECAAVVVLLGDMPGVTPSDHRPRRRAVEVGPDVGRHHVLRRRPRPPVPLLRRRLSGLALAARRQGGVEDLDQESEDRVARIAIDGSLPRDIDTWDDYVAVCEHFGFEPEGAVR